MIWNLRKVSLHPRHGIFPRKAAASDIIRGVLCWELFTSLEVERLINSHKWLPLFIVQASRIIAGVIMHGQQRHWRFTLLQMSRGDLN
jgi:hypothetical protein